MQSCSSSSQYRTAAAQIQMPKIQKQKVQRYFQSIHCLPDTTSANSILNINQINSRIMQNCQDLYSIYDLILCMFNLFTKQNITFKNTLLAHNINMGNNRKQNNIQNKNQYKTEQNQNTNHKNECQNGNNDITNNSKSRIIVNSTDNKDGKSQLIVKFWRRISMLIYSVVSHYSLYPSKIKSLHTFWWITSNSVQQQIQNDFVLTFSQSCRCQDNCSSKAEGQCQIQSLNSKNKCICFNSQAKIIAQFKSKSLRTEILVNSLRCFNVFIKNYENIILTSNSAQNQNFTCSGQSNSSLNNSHYKNYLRSIESYIKQIICIISEQLSHSQTETEYNIYLAFEYCKFLLAVLPTRISNINIDNSNDKAKLYQQLFDQFCQASMIVINLMKKFYTSDVRSNKIYRNQFLQIVLISVRSFQKIIPFRKINILKNIVNYLNRNQVKNVQSYVKSNVTLKQKRAMLIFLKIKQHWSEIKQKNLFLNYCKMVKPQKVSLSSGKQKACSFNQHTLRLRLESTKEQSEHQQNRHKVNNAIKNLKRKRSESMKIQKQSRSTSLLKNTNCGLKIKNLKRKRSESMKIQKQSRSTSLLKNTNCGLKTEIKNQIQVEMSKVLYLRFKNRTYSSSFHGNTNTNNTNIAGQNLTLSNCVSRGKENSNRNKFQSKQIQLKLEDYRWRQIESLKGKTNQLKLQPLKIISRKK